MRKGEYQWQLTYFKPGFILPLTISEDNPQFKELKHVEGLELVSASLVDLSKFVITEEDDNQYEAIVCHIDFRPNTKLTRLFRRVEKGLLSGNERVIPCIEYQTDGKTKYLFCYKDKTFITDNSRFYRKE